MKRFAIALLSLAALLASAVWAPSASASTSFPEALRKELGLATIAGTPPGCQLCHQTDLGGLNTATKPFGRSLRKAGAMGGAVNSLIAALRSLDADGVDSDGDGTPDIAELKAGADPNVSSVPDVPSATDAVPLPQTGCALGGRAEPSGAWLLLAGVLLWLKRRGR